MSDRPAFTVLGGGLHTGIDGVGSNNVNSWDGKSFLLGVLKQVDESRTSHDTRLHRGGKLSESLSNEKDIS